MRQRSWWMRRLSICLGAIGLLATAAGTASAQVDQDAQARKHQALGVQQFDRSGMPDWWQPEYNSPFFAPNDPYFPVNSPPGFPGQWHLDNQRGTNPAPDVNIVPAWARGLTGAGVTVGIVDDGLQINHPDLAPNYDAANSFDFGQNDNNPSPVFNNQFNGAGNLTSYGDNHGTSVAGVAGARGGNQIGGTGAAPMVSLSGLRIDFRNQGILPNQFADATLYNSSGNNTDIKIKNHSYGISVPYILTQNEVNALKTSSAAGTVHVFAAGNERAAHGAIVGNNGQGSVAIDGDANKKHNQSIQETIVVGALASSGIFASYSNWGANMHVTAPSSSFRPGEVGITTTDRTGFNSGAGGYNFTAAADNPGNTTIRMSNDQDPFPDADYTSTFGGTSSAAPLVSGILALAKQVNPMLDERMTKHLLARTSIVIDAGDASATGGWNTNAAGFEFNQNYGWGLIDADALTKLAAEAVGVTPLVMEVVGETTVDRVIPDNNANGIFEDFTLFGMGELEEVEVTLDITHSYRGDLEAFLQSPSGTLSRLMFRNAGDGQNNIDWTFTTNEFWGENPLGDWRLTVRDVFGFDIGRWNNFSILAKTGSLVLVPEPSSVAMVGIGGGVFLSFVLRRRRRSV